MHEHDYTELGVFESAEDADRAVHELINSGFDANVISVIAATDDHARLHPYLKGHEPDGTGAAAAGGSAIGAVLGGLAVATGIAATGGTAILAAGPLILGAGGGAVAGGFAGLMTRRGVEPDVADYFNGALEQGDILVAVEAGGLEERAAATAALRRAGARPTEMES